MSPRSLASPSCGPGRARQQRAGWKESDVGFRSGGAEGIRKYRRTKSVVAERIAMKKEPNWYPYSRTKGTDPIGGGQVPRSPGLAAPSRPLT